MARIERRGTGMMEHQVTIRERSDFASEEERAQAFFDAIEQNCISDNVREKNFQQAQTALAQAYKKMDPAWFCRESPQHVDVIRLEMEKHPSRFVKAYFGEDHAYAIMQEWLAAYNRLAVERKKHSPDIAVIIASAEALGQLQERMWWRSGIDPETQAKREVLALIGRAQVKAGKRGNELRSSSSFAATHGVEAQAMADEIAAKSPNLSWAAIRNTVAARFGVSSETIKKSLRNPKKSRVN